ncbi:MAG: hypothetical protein NC212_08595 [Staphylococcus sp.]|nr:hypothetical protein [Staphylococcus sp.]
MKPQIALSPEQMAELKSLGLDCSDASMCCINFNGIYAYVGGEEAETVKDCINGKFYVEICPAYTLEDIIYKTNANILYRPTDKGIMEWRCQVQGSDYDDFNYFNGIGNTPLDAAFAMLKYAIKNHPNKIKRL